MRQEPLLRQDRGGALRADGTVGRAWTARFGLVWLGLWAAQLAPVQLLLPLQLAELDPDHKVRDFALVAGALLGAGYGAYTSVDQALVTQVLPDARTVAGELGLMNVAVVAPQAWPPLSPGWSSRSWAATPCCSPSPGWPRCSGR